MYPLVDAIHVLLKGRPWDYAFCGGWAIDLFLGWQTRRHSDVDLLAYWPDRDRLIEDMMALGFTVYEMLGGGLAHRITDVRVQRRIKRNIFCIRQGCDLVRLKEAGEPEIFAIDFRRIGQTQPDFLEFLFNDRTPEEFLYARDPSIRRDRRKAILSAGGGPVPGPGAGPAVQSHRHPAGGLPAGLRAGGGADGQRAESLAGRRPRPPLPAGASLDRGAGRRGFRPVTIRGERAGAPPPTGSRRIQSNGRAALRMKAARPLLFDLPLTVAGFGREAGSSPACPAAHIPARLIPAGRPG